MKAAPSVPSLENGGPPFVEERPFQGRVAMEMRGASALVIVLFAGAAISPGAKAHLNRDGRGARTRDFDPLLFLGLSIGRNYVNGRIVVQR